MKKPAARAPKGVAMGAGGGIGGARIRAAGMSVATKFALATTATVTASLIVLAITLYSTLRGIMSDEVDEAGVQAVRALAVMDAECWMPFHGTALQGMDKDAEAGPLRINLSPAEKGQLDKRSLANRQRLQQFVEKTGTKLLDAAVVDPGMSKVLSGSGPIQLELSGPTRSIGEVTIQAGSYVSGGRRQQARTYTTDVHDQQGRVSARAIVALSEAKIADSLSRVVTSLAVLTAVFIGIGVLVSRLLASKVTRPIQHLCEDMDVVAHGHFSHRTRAESSDEVGVLARTFDRMTQGLLAFQDVQKQQAAQEHQIEVAREVQAALLPEKLPAIPGFECAAASRSAARVAGDFYDVSEMAGGAKLLAVVSASGGGVPGAMVVTMARSLMKALAGNEESPAELLRKMNHFLAPDLRRGMYVSALLVRVEPATGRLVMANAGHHPLVVCRRGAKTAEPSHGDGIALGFDKGPVFDRTIKDREISLAPGERVLLCTRSLFGIKDAQGQEIGEAAVYELFQKESRLPSNDFVPLTLATLESFREGAAATEDITFLTLKRVAAPP